MGQRRHGLRLALESGKPLRIRREGLRQHLNRDVAIELGIARPIDLAHSPGADEREDLVRAEASTRLKRHVCMCVHYDVGGSG